MNSFRLSSFGTSSSFVPNIIDKTRQNNLNEDNIQQSLLIFKGTFPNNSSLLLENNEVLQTEINIEPAEDLEPGSFYVCIQDNTEFNGVIYYKGDIALAVPSQNEYIKIDRQIVPTNLSIEQKNQETFYLNSSNGEGVIIPKATDTEAGLLTSSSYRKLQTIQEGAEVNVKTNLSLFAEEDKIIIENDNGKGIQIPTATKTRSGIFTKNDKIKLDLILDNAEPNVPTNLSATIQSNKIHIDTNTETNSGIDLPISTTETIGLMSSEDKQKLDTIQEGAANIFNYTERPLSKIKTN